MNTDDLKKLCCLETHSVMDAVNSLNATGRGIVLVCKENKSLLGIVTDSDIRRGLLRGLELQSPIAEVVQIYPQIIEEHQSRQEIINKFVRNGLRAMPEVDKEGKVLNCHFREQYLERKNKASTLMIMAGGFGSRMGDLTKDIPKPLLEVRGKPMIQHIIEAAAAEQFDNIFISTFYKSDLIAEFCGDGEQFGVNIQVIREDHPLGTGGSFGLLDSIQGPVVVTNADIMSSLGYRRLLDYHEMHNAVATISVREHVIQHPFGVVLYDGLELTGFKEKPIWRTNINAGIYVLDAELRKYIPPNEPIDMPDVIEAARQAGGSVMIFPLHETWSDLGSEAEYLEHQ